MSQNFADALNWVPKSRALSTTLSRAHDFARAYGHASISLEHLLLSLLEDDDASVVVQASNIDLDSMSDEISTYLQNIPASDENLPGASPELVRILDYAVAAAQQSKRRDINGAIVLAAIVGEGKSAAAAMLKRHGMTFEEAIRALKSAPPSASAPTPAPSRQNGPDQQSHHDRDAGRETEAAAQHPPVREQTGEDLESTEDLLAAARRRVEAGRQSKRQQVPPPQDSLSSSRQAQSYEREVEPGHGRSAVQAVQDEEWRGQDAQFDRRDGGEDTHRPSYDNEWDGAGVSGEHYAAAEPDATPPASRRADRSEPVPPVKPPPPSWIPDAERQPDRGSGMPQRTPPPMPPLPELPHGDPRSNPSYEAPPRPRPAAPGAPWPVAVPAPPGAPHGATRHERYADAASHLDRVHDTRLDDPSRRQRQGGSGPQRGQTVDSGHLAENIPRRMRVGVPYIVEIRIARSDIATVTKGLEGAGRVHRHDIQVTQAMSVRIKAPTDTFYIEPGSPEVQWIENTLGVLEDDYASWRWTITPRRGGRTRLKLIVSARTVGADGLAAETALPDQTIEVKVGINYARSFGRLTWWVALAAAGGVISHFSEQLLLIGRMAVGMALGTG